MRAPGGGFFADDGGGGTFVMAPGTVPLVVAGGGFPFGSQNGLAGATTTQVGLATLSFLSQALTSDAGLHPVGSSRP
jgi:hypothetical protein